MGYRDVKVYDGEFPTIEQIYSGDPTAPPMPEESWKKHVGPTEFAVRYKDFKTGLPRDSNGDHVSKCAEICRIFDTVEEARAHCKDVTRTHWTVGCFVYDHAGKQIAAISNQKEVTKYALLSYAGVLFWIAVPAALAAGVLWTLYQAVRVILFPNYTSSLGWMGWFGLGVVGLAAVIGAWYWKIQLRVARVAKKIRGAISPEERKRYEELNTLFGTADPVERERFLKLSKELQEKVGRALKP